jgi:phosphoribosylpyrophosphate synthetase
MAQGELPTLDGLKTVVYPRFYMRQDERLHPGEAVTSHTFSKLLSRGLDFLVTVDPHLHRDRSLDEIYAIQTRAIRRIRADHRQRRRNC